MSVRQSMFQFNDTRDWFFRARFGMFVHWGIYAINGWHEQEQYRRGTGRSEYSRLAPRFNPHAFNPDKWLDLAEQSGMRYIVLTAKHIDGFCMFDSAVSDFKITNTPFKKDIVGMLADACHRRNFHFGVYFSALDNLHKTYPRSGKNHESAAEPGDEPDYDKYMQFVRAQVRELCGNYGKIDVFWWDGNRTGVRDPSINAMIRKLQPSCVINDRGWDEGDFGTPERNYDDAAAYTPEPFSKPTEACESIGSQSWGFRKDEDYFTPIYLVRRMDLMFSKGANFLLNVGPDADGRIPVEQERILNKIGRWYNRVKEAWDDTRFAGSVAVNKDVIMTVRDKTVYVHLVKSPATTAVIMHPLNILPVEAKLLNTGAPVRCDLNRLPVLYMAEGKTALRIFDLPVEQLADEALVIKLEFDRPVNNLPVVAFTGEETEAALK
ncbi:MAG: alpha-L-fucosidase [Kiritimatiellia bacterium]|nr:alpha-L-fucosidase [Kiritimatiellia bacterium]